MYDINKIQEVLPHRYPFLLIDNIIDCFKQFSFIKEIVLGISEGEVNKSFIDYAKSKKIKYIIGDERDV